MYLVYILAIASFFLLKLFQLSYFFNILSISKLDTSIVRDFIVPHEVDKKMLVKGLFIQASKQINEKLFLVSKFVKNIQLLGQIREVNKKEILGQELDPEEKAVHDVFILLQ